MPGSPAPGGAPGRAVLFAPAHRWWLLGAVAVAAALRLLHLGEWSLWVDEAHTLRDATMPLADFRETDRVFYAVPFLLLRGLFMVGLGQGEWALRLPFALIGVGTVWLLGTCGRRIVGATPAVLAAWLLAIHPWHVYWSQNARGYVIVVLTSLLAIERAFRYARDPRTRDMVAVWLWIALGTMAHPTGGLVAVALVVYFALRRFERVGVRMVLVIVGLAAVTAWLLPVLATTFFPDFVRAKEDTRSLRHFVQTAGFYFRPGMLLVAAIGMWLLRTIGGRDRALLLGACTVTPFVVMAIVAHSLVLVTARYAICTLPALVWLVAFACVRIGQAMQTAAAPRLACVAAAMLLPLLIAGDHVTQLVLYYGPQHGQRAMWREAAQLLESRAGDAPLRVLTVNQRTLQYYLRPGHWAGKVPKAFAANEVLSLEDWMIRDGLDEEKRTVHAKGAVAHVDWHLDRARAKGAMFAVVVTWPELVEQDGDSSMRRELSQRFALAEVLPCWVGPKDETIHVFLPKEP